MSEVFQYAVLRVVPSIPRGEALNVGVVVHCRRLGFLAVGLHVDAERLRALDPALDVEALRAHLDGLALVADGDAAAGPVAELDRSERFHWLVAPSSTIVQPGPVHTGLCDDGGAVVDKLLDELVR